MMLSAISMFFISAWMLAIALHHGVASPPVVALLASMMVSIRLQPRLFSRKHIPVQSPARIHRQRSVECLIPGKRRYVSNIAREIY
jgi:hypothetical protein